MLQVKKKKITLKLGNGTYINTGTIKLPKTNAVLTIEGNGQTIDANKQQAFYIENFGSMILKNITITNGESNHGGAIENRGTLTITQSTLNNNNAYNGGAIINFKTLTINQTTLNNNTAYYGGAVRNKEGTMLIRESTLNNNTAKEFGGAIENSRYHLFSILNSNFTNNHAKIGGAIQTFGYFNLTGNKFTENTADDKDTNYLAYAWSGFLEGNVYESTDIALETIKLSVRNNQIMFNIGEEVVLNYTIALKNPIYYDRDILERLDDITIYVNGVEYVTTKYENYTLSNLKPGNYSVYYKTCNQESNTVNFTVSPITNWQQLRDAVKYASEKKENLTLKLENGNYINTGTITWFNKNMVLTIDGNGQTIDGNQLQVFEILDGSSMLLKNITIKNAVSYNGGAIENDGTLIITQATLTNNTAKRDGGAIRNFGTLTITQSILANNTAKYDGGTLYNYGTLNISESTLANNTAVYGGALINTKTDEYISIVKSNFTSNHAQRGGAILSRGFTNLTDNTFTDNTADNTETIDLNGYWNGRFNTNAYNSTDISLKTMDLRIKNNQTLFKKGEKVVLNYTIALKNPNYYDKDVLKRLDDITVYINGVKNVTTGYENYTLSNLKPGKYEVYIRTCNQESNIVTFSIIEETDTINLTTWDVEMVQGRSVTLSAYIGNLNGTVNYGSVYFEIDGIPLVDENGSILYAPVEDNWADLPYDMPKEISLGNHTLTALYLENNTILATDNKTLTIIENIPEGAGDEDEIPSEDEKQETRPQNTRSHKTIHSTITATHKIITNNNVIPADNVLTLGELNEIYNQTFINGHLLLYIDGELVFNGTVNDDLTTVILKIIEKFLGKHEIKVEFTDNNNETRTYTENITIT